MTKQSLQQQNCEVKICRFGKKKPTEKQICNLWLCLKYCLNKIFTIEKKLKTLMIMTNLLYGTLMENPIIMKFNVNVEKLILTLIIIIRLINLKYMYY